MKYKDFLELLMRHKKIREIINNLYDVGVDLIEGKYELTTDIEGMFQQQLDMYFTVEGVDWINWFIYENEYGQKDWSKLKMLKQNQPVNHEKNKVAYGATYENGKPICYSFESTWEYVKQYLKNKERKIIYGVFLKKDESYFGYFNSEKDAIDELKIQGKRLFSKIGVFDEKRKCFINEKTEQYLITIHEIVLR